MSFVRIWLHCVWGTKNKEPYLIGDIKTEIINHIKENAGKKKIYIDFINGSHEHLHCLISLGPDQTIADTMHLIKGESSFWINKANLLRTKFEWADEYYAVSVSESQVNNVREYIRNQEEHHKRRTWQEEYDDFMNKYGFKKPEG